MSLIILILILALTIDLQQRMAQCHLGIFSRHILLPKFPERVYFLHWHKYCYLKRSDPGVVTYHKLMNTEPTPGGWGGGGVHSHKCSVLT